MPFEKPLSQTYDRSTVAHKLIMEEKIDGHVTYFQYYALKLNLFLFDAVGVSINVISSLNTLEELYVLLSESHEVNELCS